MNVSGLLDIHAKKPFCGRGSLPEKTGLSAGPAVLASNVAKTELRNVMASFNVTGSLRKPRRQRQRQRKRLMSRTMAV